MVPFILLIAVFLYFLNRKYRSYLIRKYELKLFVLRDKLRDYAIDGKIKKADWTFDYLDSSISKMTVHFQMLNIFHAMFLRNNIAKDERLRDFSNQLKASLTKNIHLQEIFNDYQKVLSSYMKEKHVVILSVVVVSIYGMLRTITQYKKYKISAKEAVASLIFSPETSTSLDYA